VTNERLIYVVTIEHELASEDVAFHEAAAREDIARRFASVPGVRGVLVELGSDEPPAPSDDTN
jgi:hypothetical protein